MTRMQKVPVTARALLQRVNRKLGPHRQLRAAQGRERDSLGDYYLLDTKANAVRDHDVDLEKLARRLRAMRDWEEVAR